MHLRPLGSDVSSLRSPLWERRQPDQPRQRPMAAALPTAKQQDHAGQTRLRMDVDARQVDRLHLTTARAINIQPTIASSQRRADRRIGAAFQRSTIAAQRSRSAALVLAAACSHARCRQCGVPPMASRLLFAHPLESRAGVVGRHSRLLGGLLRRAALAVEPRPYARRDRGRLDAVTALQLDLGTILPLSIARGWRCRSSCAAALAWHVPIL
jgi:hypothetical protein